MWLQKYCTVCSKFRFWSILVSVLTIDLSPMRHDLICASSYSYTYPPWWNWATGAILLSPKCILLQNYFYSFAMYYCFMKAIYCRTSINLIERKSSCLCLKLKCVHMFVSSCVCCQDMLCKNRYENRNRIKAAILEQCPFSIFLSANQNYLKSRYFYLENCSFKSNAPLSDFILRKYLKEPLQCSVGAVFWFNETWRKIIFVSITIDKYYNCYILQSCLWL